MTSLTRVLWILLALTLIASVAVDLLGPSKEAYHVWDHKTFFAWYGFLGCVVIVYVSKWLGKYWLQRHTDYYEGTRPPDARETGRTGGGADA